MLIVVNVRELTAFQQDSFKAWVKIIFSVIFPYFLNYIAGRFNE